MPTLESFLYINARQSIVFDLSQNYEKRLSWDNYLRKAVVLNPEKPLGVGSKVYCENRLGLGVTVEYISFKRPDVVAIKLNALSFFFTKFSGSWRFKAINENETKAIFRYHYECPNRLFTWVFKWMLTADLKQRLGDLKEGVEREHSS